MSGGSVSQNATLEDVNTPSILKESPPQSFMAKRDLVSDFLIAGCNFAKFKKLNISNLSLLMCNKYVLSKEMQVKQRNLYFSLWCFSM
jgi:hypothetical protein